MNRFQNRRGRKPSIGGLTVSVLVAAGCFALFLGGILGTRREAWRKELENLQQVLDQSAVVCYALEGTYPESLSYLKEHYGISWNEHRYLVDFEAVGNNLPPDITVIPRN